MTISGKTLHAARESLQIIMGHIELMLVETAARKEHAQKAKAEVLKLAKLLGAELAEEL